MRAALDALHPPKPRHPFPTPEPGRPKALNLLGTLAHHPELTAAYHAFNGHILFATTLSPRQRELLVLRVAARREAEYEWLQHTILAADAGLTPEDVARVQEGPDAAGWAPLDAAMLRAVDELIDDALISDDTWAALAAELDRQQLMDLVFTVGAYELLAMAFKTFGIEIDADLEAWRR
jgi:alkylhydroperoxidase family enzyme